MATIRLICAYCKGLALVETKDIKKSDLHFCSHSCRAIFYNHKRRKLFPRKCLRLGCENFVTKMDRRRKFCCQSCATTTNNVSRYTREKIIDEINQFVNNQKRIPTKNELIRLNRPARKLFGTWNKAIIAAGFDPNPVMFAKHYLAQDGHRCDSMAEKIVDDYLFNRGIKHQVNVLYPWKNGMTADFVIGDTWIEIFGLSGQLESYDKLRRQKLKLAKKYNIQILSISLKEVYGRGLEKRISKLI